MTVKEVDIPGVGPVLLQKRRGSRSLRISITPAGQVRVSLPYWATYHQAMTFAASRGGWIAKHRPVITPIQHDTRVGKAHQMSFHTKPGISRPTSRIHGNEILITIPASMTVDSPNIQKIATRAAIKALTAEAESLLPNRIASLATKHGFSYKSVQIKRLSSRWGSCDSHGNITLNCYLMQLQWHLIDYVLLHELVHTRVMAHGERFWRELGQYIDDLPSVRKEIRDRRPSLVL